MARNLESGELEMRLSWPGMENVLEPMHWTQKVNPVDMWVDEAYIGEDVEIDYTCVSCPYYSYNYWGGLEYNNDDALLDGSVSSSDWWFAVGAISTFDLGGEAAIPGPYEDYDIDYYGATKQTLLEVKPNEYYFEPKCVSCLACYDANGQWRGGHNGTSGCPEFCRGLADGRAVVDADPGIRRWEAAAAHHVAIFSKGFAAENCSAGTAGGNVSTGDDVVNPGCLAAAHGAISGVPLFMPGGGLFSGFFVAPRAANFTFFGVFDTAAELWLSSNGDPRLAALELGGDDVPEPTDGDEIDGWTRWGGSWYKWFSDERVAAEGAGTSGSGALSWPEAQAYCGMEGGALAKIDSAEENQMIIAELPYAPGWGQIGWIGLTDSKYSSDGEGMWYWADATGAKREGASLQVDRLYTNWLSGEPNDSGGEDCAVIKYDNQKSWYDLGCEKASSFVCEIDTTGTRGRSATHHLDAGEARYFELLHVHNDSVAGPLLGLSLLIEPDDGSTPFRTRVDGDQSLSMEVCDHAMM